MSKSPTRLALDPNHNPLAGGLANDTSNDILPLSIDVSTGALEVIIASGGSGGNVNLTKVGGTNVSLGQTTMSASLPVAVASDNNLAKETGGNLATIASQTSGLSTSANQTNGTQQSKLTNGTNIADVVAGDTGFNGVATASATKTIQFTTSTPGVQTLLANTLVEGYAWVEVIATSIGSGLAWTGGFSPNTGGTYVSGAMWTNTNGGVSNSSLGISTTISYRCPIVSNYFQLAVSALTSGTVSGYVVLHASPFPLASNNTVSQSSTWTMSPNNSNASLSIVASNSTVTAGSFPGGGYVEVSVHGTYAGVSFGITASDDTGTTFYNVPIYDLSANAWLAAGSTITPGTNASKIYLVPQYGFGGQIKVLASAYTSGTATVNINRFSFSSVSPSSMSQIMDSAGNNRGANVTASNELVVSDSGLRPAGTSLNPYSTQITTKTTTTPTASTAYISSIAIVQTVAGTLETLTIQDKQGTPLALVNALAITSLTATQQYNFQTPVKMVSGIDIITAGTTAGTTNVFINYYQ